MKHIYFISSFSRVALVILFLGFYGIATANPVITINQKGENVSIAPSLEEFVDSADSVSSIESIIKNDPFENANGKVPIYLPKINSVWLKFSVRNNIDNPDLFLNIPYSNLSEVTLYEISNDGYKVVGIKGNEIKLEKKFTNSPNIVFNLSLAKGQEKEYILHVRSVHPIMVPASVATEEALNDETYLQTLIFGLYFGVLLIMVLYNLFLYFATRDGNYFIYTVYLVLLALAQLAAIGYGYKYIWPRFQGFNQYAVIWTSSLSAISGLIFSMYFLQTKRYSRRIHSILKVLIGVYILGMVICLFGQHDISYNILNYNSLLSVIAVLVSSVYIAHKGFRSAYFYLIAWLALLISFIILVLRNINVLPFNTVTTYIFFIGSTLEVALLSIALADKINTLRKDKERSQAEALRISEKNEQLVREQNVVLENKVAERTQELQSANSQLTVAFKELKDAQIQLVEAEKMASLGLLTAGIAHEINNPINFVKSNIKPLTLDINDLVEVLDEYEKLHQPGDHTKKLNDIDKLKSDIDINFVKTEIYSLLKGIEDGAERTAEIVRGLRTFSRLDESQIKTVNIHEGIDSTLVILRNYTPDNVKIVRNYEAGGVIECFPGKLNQVFMNILSNAIQAIKLKPRSGKETITITTKDVDSNVVINIKDSGPGMTQEVKQRIFDPFFTTKDVGEGTGLGMAIVFKIIQEHGGNIEVVSSEGEGAEFIITLHQSIPEKPII